MLVLMRRPEESIHIGEHIVITVVGMERNRVRIGVKAPCDLPVDREEIHERKADLRRGTCKAQRDETDAGGLEVETG
jgi:carbon storage regulator